MLHPSIILLAACLLVVTTAQAEHENDHRYTVRGYVLDKNELPIAGSSVSIWLDNSIISTGTTDSQGYYRIRLHLHDHNLGETLLVRTSAGEASIKVKFEPGDKSTIRRHYVNFVGDELIEERLFWREMTGWLYGVATVTAVVALAILFRRPLKKILQSRRKAPAAAVSRPASIKSKKRRKRHTT